MFRTSLILLLLSSFWVPSSQAQPAFLELETHTEEANLYTGSCCSINDVVFECDNSGNIYIAYGSFEKDDYGSSICEQKDGDKIEGYFSHVLHKFNSSGERIYRKEEHSHFRDLEPANMLLLGDKHIVVHYECKGLHQEVVCYDSSGETDDTYTDMTDDDMRYRGLFFKDGFVYIPAQETTINGIPVDWSYELKAAGEHHKAGVITRLRYGDILGTLGRTKNLGMFMPEAPDRNYWLFDTDLAADGKFYWLYHKAHYEETSVKILYYNRIDQNGNSKLLTEVEGKYLTGDIEVTSDGSVFFLGLERVKGSSKEFNLVLKYWGSTLETWTELDRIPLKLDIGRIRTSDYKIELVDDQPLLIGHSRGNKTAYLRYYEIDDLLSFEMKYKDQIKLSDMPNGNDYPFGGIDECKISQDGSRLLVLYSVRKDSYYDDNDERQDVLEHFHIASYKMKL